MKTLLITTIIAASVSSAALADNFNNNTLGLTLQSGVLDFSIDANKEGLTDFEVGVTGLAHTLGNADATVRGALKYNLDNDTIGIIGEYNPVWTLGTYTSIYGSAAVEYVTADNDLGNGAVFFDPSIGAAYQITDRVSVFGELGYAWNIDNDWARVGGYVEVGMPITLSETIAITPSLVRGIDDGIEETNLNLSVALSF